MGTVWKPTSAPAPRPTLATASARTVCGGFILRHPYCCERAGPSAVPAVVAPAMFLTLKSSRPKWGQIKFGILSGNHLRHHSRRDRRQQDAIAKMAGRDKISGR